MINVENKQTNLQSHFSVISEVAFVVVKSPIFRLRGEEKCQGFLDHFMIYMNKILPLRKKPICFMEIASS